MRNLFIRAHELRHGRGDNPLGTGWEDTLTDAIAFYLASDHEALDAWVSLVMGEPAESVKSIATQYIDGSERPDLAFVLQSGALLVVENKTGAALQNRQLQRYLALRGPDGSGAFLAFVGMRERTIPPDVLSNDRYRRPCNAEHFRWQDLYACIPEGGTDYGPPWLRSQMRDYMGVLGFAPSSLQGEWHRLFEDRTIPENRLVQKEFGRKLAGVRSYLKTLGLAVSGVSHMGLQATVDNPSNLLYVTVMPARPKREFGGWPRSVHLDNEVLRVALNWGSHVDLRVVEDVYRRIDCPFRTKSGDVWWPTRPYRYSQKRIRLDVVANLRPFLQDELAIQHRLTQACSELLRHLASLTPHLALRVQ